jgi:hypothetical protein
MPTCLMAAATPNLGRIADLLLSEVPPFGQLVVVPPVLLSLVTSCCATIFEELDPMILSLVALFARQLTRGKRETNVLAA